MWSGASHVRAGNLVPAFSGCRSLHIAAGLSVQAQRPQKRPEPVEIPGLEPITYWDRMHYVPGLADPKCPKWDRGWEDPFHRRGPKYEEMPLYKEKPCYTFHQRTKMLEEIVGTADAGEPEITAVKLDEHNRQAASKEQESLTFRVEEGSRPKTSNFPASLMPFIIVHFFCVKQALWLTKSKLIEGLPKQILQIAADSANYFEDQDERVKAAISQARFWTTTEIRPKRNRFCPVLLQNLLHLCRILQPRFPTLGNRTLAENYRVTAMWERELDIFRVCGLNGVLLSSKEPLPTVAEKEEIFSSENYILPTFYPISPNIDLQQTHVYEVHNDTGFRDGYPFPHAHTVYITEHSAHKARFKPEPLRAKMIMFTFANAFARAKLLYGEEPKVLDNPITVQCIATNGRMFQFLVLQLNTTDLQSNDGIKNLIWLDQDQLLYDYAKCLPAIRKKMIQVPAGLSGYCPETFNKFLAMYLYGAV